MKDQHSKRLISVTMTQAALKRGQTVALVGPTGMNAAEYIAGLSDEERSRLKVVELVPQNLTVTSAFAVPQHLLRIGGRHGRKS